MGVRYNRDRPALKRPGYSTTAAKATFRTAATAYS